MEPVPQVRVAESSRGHEPIEFGVIHLGDEVRLIPLDLRQWVLLVWTGTPQAGPQARLKGGARDERTQEAVAW